MSVLNLAWGQGGGLLPAFKSALLLRGFATSQSACKKVTYHKPSECLTLFDRQDGERKSMVEAEKRFKRLDWGVYIRPRAGRNQLRYKRSARSIWNREQHVFCAKYHISLLNRMISPEVKAKRFLPEDIYEKYNRTSLTKHLYTKLKNAANIERFGSTLHRFPGWKAHLSHHGSRYNRPEKVLYEPPGYVRNIFDHGGVYSPEFVPQDRPAPSFERPLIRANKKMRDSYLVEALNLETFSSANIPRYHPLLKPMFKKY
ncbi:hypothetical protein TCAL_09297 [Tigriopus californicus]|uniref:Large ribosomal subunit protein bL35m n=1 Tax=Tigriopus californicus TaxID=6832 RepID=A0A553NYE1_TIGCA|nr:uncharacterized protein LOC131886241 [Tigriopus californicus]TRY70432.1 hypothetical protein TCAL_09297 [Tigriopus californicus]